MSTVRTTSTRGFTLIELMTAIAIFAVLAGMLFQIVKGGLDVWRMGEGNRQALEKGTALLDEIARDLRMIRADNPLGATDPPIRLLADYGLFDMNQDDVEETLLQRLRFVRSCPEERFDDTIRRAGDAVGGQGVTSDVGVRSSFVGAPGGLAEIAYGSVRVPGKDQDTSLLTLYRMFQTPVGGETSLFRSTWFEQPAKLLDAAVPLADNVLFLGFELWSRDTRSFDEAPNTATGPLNVWDSTRATLLDEIGHNRFLLAKDESSLAHTHDDVFPRRIRATLVLERDQDEAYVPHLLEPVPASATMLRLDSVRSIDAKSPYPFVKVDGEWMKWKRIVENQLVVERGQRGTAALGHAAGARVHVGETFQRTIDIPVYREDWNDP